MPTIELNQVFELHLNRRGSFIIETVDCKGSIIVDLLSQSMIYRWYQRMLERGQFDEADTFKSEMLHVHRN